MSFLDIDGKVIVSCNDLVEFPYFGKELFFLTEYGLFGLLQGVNLGLYGVELFGELWFLIFYWGEDELVLLFVLRWEIGKVGDFWLFLYNDGLFILDCLLKFTVFSYEFLSLFVESLSLFVESLSLFVESLSLLVK